MQYDQKRKKCIVVYRLLHRVRIGMYNPCHLTFTQGVIGRMFVEAPVAAAPKLGIRHITIVQFVSNQCYHIRSFDNT